MIWSGLTTTVSTLWASATSYTASVNRLLCGSTAEIAGIRLHATTLCSLSTITFFGTAPTMRSASLPSLKTSKVGMLCT